MLSDIDFNCFLMDLCLKNILKNADLRKALVIVCGLNWPFLNFSKQNAVFLRVIEYDRKTKQNEVHFVLVSNDTFGEIWIVGFGLANEL